jgi:hypothetical protein
MAPLVLCIGSLCFLCIGQGLKQFYPLRASFNVKFAVILEADAVTAGDAGGA